MKNPTDPTLRPPVRVGLTWLAHSFLFLQLLLQPSSAMRAADRDSEIKALRRGTSPIWVEPDHESVTIPREQLGRGDYSDRHDSIANDAAASAWERWFQNLWDFGSGNSFLARLFSWLSYVWRIVLLMFFLLLVGWLLYRLFRNKAFRTWIRRPREWSEPEDWEQKRVKVSDLPFEIEQPIIGLRAHAERLRSTGDYSQAILYLFSYLLVELDHAHCIRLERGKTNGAYMREVIPWSGLASYMRSAVGLFELAYFGRRQITRDAFEELWGRLIDIEETLSLIRSGKLRVNPSSSAETRSSAVVPPAGAAL